SCTASPWAAPSPCCCTGRTRPSGTAPSSWRPCARLLFMALQISEKVKPHPVVVTLLTQVEELIPTWKIVPTKDVIDFRLQGPRQARKHQEEQAHLPGQAAAQDGAGAAQDQHGRRGQPLRGDHALLHPARRGRHRDRPGGQPRAVRPGRQHRQDNQALPGDVARPHRRRARRQCGAGLCRHRRLAQQAQPSPQA
uniref:Uncharacterized protein n=2 Tax=Aegilops tauschii subsp. strangulata TaxID=200361 RepID=A0A452YY54_AEGTS